MVIKMEVVKRAHENLKRVSSSNKKKEKENRKFILTTSYARFMTVSCARRKER